MAHVSLCPLKPDPEPSRIVSGDPIASARLPSNACAGDRCAWWLAQLDPRTGKAVAGNCAIPVAAAMLAQIGGILGSFTVRTTRVGEAPTPTEEKPS